jgi:hypothetical protein
MIPACPAPKAVEPQASEEGPSPTSRAMGQIEEALFGFEPGHRRAEARPARGLAGTRRASALLLQPMPGKVRVVDASLSLQFLEKLLQVLAEGRRSSTYKYAVLIGLIDLCVESGEPPQMVTTAQLARRVVELYWRQVRRYQPAADVLRQNADKPAKIPRLIRAFREQHPDLVSPPQRPARRHPAFERLIAQVERVLIEQPLPKLQRVGGREEQFLYRLGWEQPDGGALPGRSFDNRVLFVERAEEHLFALKDVLRPLIQQHWMVMVQAINRLPEAELGEFLFGSDRRSLVRLHRPLLELQEGRCFYCERALVEARCAVDHFLPWSRYPDDGLDNLVLAHADCNGKKKHYPADMNFGRQWEARSRGRSDDLDQIADDSRWPRDRGRTFGVVASHYQGFPQGVHLWAGQARLRRLGASDLPEVRAFGEGLLR